MHSTCSKAVSQNRCKRGQVSQRRKGLRRKKTPVHCKLSRQLPQLRNRKTKTDPVTNKPLKHTRSRFQLDKSDSNTQGKGTMLLCATLQFSKSLKVIVQNHFWFCVMCCLLCYYPPSQHMSLHTRLFAVLRAVNRAESSRGTATIFELKWRWGRWGGRGRATKFLGAGGQK